MEDTKIVNQKVKGYLSDYIEESTPLIEEFFSKQVNYAKSVSPIAVKMVEKYRDFIGGKRFRGAMTKLSYHMFEGEEEYDVLKASLAVEIIHCFGLIHDDIMDQDDIRRNKPTIHKQFEAELQEHDEHSKLKPDRYGDYMSMTTGDLGPFLANLIIQEANFPNERKIKYLGKLSEYIINTVYGQGMDLTYEQSLMPSQDEAMRVHQYKTAYYTIVGPLQYGAVLAGVDDKDERLAAIEKFGLPVGIAFQLKDDEMGLFSETEKIHKPIFSDLRQGKVTLLFAKTFEMADNSQLEFLKSVYGKTDADGKDLEKVREIVAETGALEYSRKICLDLIADGMSHVNEITSDEYYRELLNLIAEFVTQRDK